MALRIARLQRGMTENGAEVVEDPPRISVHPKRIVSWARRRGLLRAWRPHSRL